MPIANPVSKTTASLPYPLDELAPPTELFIVRDTSTIDPLQVKISHPLVPQMMSFWVDWATRAHGYLVLKPRLAMVDPEEMGAVPQVVVQMSGHDAIRVLSKIEFEAALRAIHEDVVSSAGLTDSTEYIIENLSRAMTSR